MSHPVQTACKGVGSLGGALFAYIVPNLTEWSDLAKFLSVVAAIFGSLAFGVSMALDAFRKVMEIRTQIFQERTQAVAATVRASVATAKATQLIKLIPPTEVQASKEAFDNLDQITPTNP